MLHGYVLLVLSVAAIHGVTWLVHGVWWSPNATSI